MLGLILYLFCYLPSQGHRSGLLAAQHDQQIALSMHGVFACGFAGVFRTFNEWANTRKPTGQLGASLWEIMLVCTKHIVLILILADHRLFNTLAHFCGANKGLPLIGQDKKYAPLIGHL